MLAALKIAIARGDYSARQLAALFVLADVVSIRHLKLARELRISSPGVTRAITRLVIDGLAFRRREAKDRRQCRIGLTDGGRQFVAELRGAA